jgi:hypothetical protein
MKTNLLKISFLAVFGLMSLVGLSKGTIKVTNQCFGGQS